ncbi:MAG: hypothetical protein WC756_19675 [Taibaiella sp.]|jgi:DNA-binding response OmpR family regulator
MKVRGFATVNEFQKNLESDLPDLILLGIMLPDGNINNKALAQETSAKDFIPKPFDIDDFISRIKLQLQAY